MQHQIRRSIVRTAGGEETILSRGADGQRAGA